MFIHPKLASQLEWKLKDIHISLRPAYREGSISPLMCIARLMASSPQRPYQFTPAAVGRWERAYGRQYLMERLVLSEVLMPRPPWTGSSPLVLFFKCHTPGYESWLTLTLGRCTVRDSAIQSSKDDSDASIPNTPSPESRPLKYHYAVVRRNLLQDSFWSSDALSFASSHSCVNDHLDFIHIPEDDGPAGLRYGGMLTMMFKLDGARCILRDWDWTL